ncbi:plastocyanin/azurin family copper-binding protein [Micromonospora sp. WMMD1120]|uniref:cupredoxin domain-containing protein n=1 Tax=Micromonospora sp. WMMD1120 TaxID=3016106 RepID=UPI002417624C|nr:plastocyanin/azurin family copper-binding protein [Micromonospora sp. WMMD1120]MDG4810067.1 plastocyanin/azurin family copper-binding protein [Micromonospora sp. WMMD1120]
MRSRQRMRRAGAQAVALLVLTSGCGVWGPEGGPGGSGAAGLDSSGRNAPQPVEASVSPDGVQRIEITLTDELAVVPSLVRARPGVIEFTFRNDGVTPHSVTVDAGAPTTTVPPSVDGAAGTGNLNGGQAGTVRVTVTASGRYPYPCRYHLTTGMRGVLEVSGPPLALPTTPTPGAGR